MPGRRRSGADDPRGSLINKEKNKGTLVLIEPDLSVRDALTVLLQGQGWNVESLDDCNGIEAALEGADVIAVVSESSLPDCTPQEILEQGARRNLPVIFTGHDLPLQGAVDLIRQGAMDFLDKPFPQSRLLDLLDRLGNGQNS
jgi:two-component system response regulator FixJ